MKNRPPYAEILKSSLPKIVNDFKSKPSDEAENIAVSQMRRGHEYRKNLHGKTNLQQKAS